MNIIKIPENNRQDSATEFEAALDRTVTQLAELIRARPTEHQIQALVKVGADMMSMRDHAVQLLARGEGRQSEVCKLAEEIFEGNATAWLFTQNWALNWKAPVEMFNSDEGIQAVLDTLVRMQWGVFS